MTDIRTTISNDYPTAHKRGSPLFASLSSHNATIIVFTIADKNNFAISVTNDNRVLNMTDKSITRQINVFILLCKSCSIYYFKSEI